MKITIFTASSQGDIQPCATFEIGLQQAAYRVHLASGVNNPIDLN
jgi:hypothetical protein